MKCKYCGCEENVKKVSTIIPNWELKTNKEKYPEYSKSKTWRVDLKDHCRYVQSSAIVSTCEACLTLFDSIKSLRLN
jgi:hypothetical protein